RALQLFVRGLQLLVGHLQLLVAGLELLDGRLQVFAGVAQLGLQARELLARALAELDLGRRARQRPGPPPVARAPDQNVRRAAPPVPRLALWVRGPGSARSFPGGSSAVRRSLCFS